MRPERIKAIACIALLALFSACSTAQIRRQAAGTGMNTIPLADKAWLAARGRLHSMCPHVPKTEAELVLALNAEHQNGCYLRLAKNSRALAQDDWNWHWLPPYHVVVAVHDEELRKRTTPKLYEEYMLGLMRYLGDQADRRKITPGQLKYAFNAAWNWLSGKMGSQRILLEDNNRPARAANAAASATLAALARELATVTTLALGVSAPARAFQPGPTNCYPYSTGDGNYTIQCY